MTKTPRKNNEKYIIHAFLPNNRKYERTRGFYFIMFFFIFEIEIQLHHSPLSFFPPATPMNTLLHFKFMLSDVFFFNCCFMHMDL